MVSPISGSCPIQHSCDTSSCTNSWTTQKHQKLVFTTSDKAARQAKTKAAYVYVRVAMS